jgi:ankyrin repeat protein
MRKELKSLSDTKNFKSAASFRANKKYMDNLTKLVEAINIEDEHAINELILSIGHLINNNDIKLSTYHNEFYGQDSKNITISPLNYALYMHKPLAAKTILEHNVLVDVNQLSSGDEYRVSTLYMATDLGNIELMQKIISMGGNVFQLDTAGYSPIHAAIATGDTQKISLLLEVAHSQNPEFSMRKFIFEEHNTTTPLPDFISSLNCEDPLFVSFQNGLESNEEIYDIMGRLV